MKTLSFKPQLKTFTAFCLICLGLAACQKALPGGDATTGAKSSVNIFITDDPSLAFDHVFLDISKVEIKVEDSSEAEHESEHESESDDHDHNGEVSGGWMNVDIHAGVYDILAFRNGLDTLFASTSFSSTKKLKKVRLTLGKNNSVELGGVPSPLTIKGNDNFVVIKIDESQVQVNNGGLTNFWIDIDAGQSIRKHGNDFELKPSVKVFSKERSGSLEGRVFPKDAKAVVTATNGTDTSTAKPEDEGEFKFIGLKPGTWALLYHATAGNYKDTTITNITIGGKEDAKVNNVTLRK
ncbi:MAG: hypothetical protein JWR61_2676 [Ferruginibacter sp.]|uniref:DUF4382 domain-containing protein n=1 Tax=Ferruginibacter sp. TaxID=1940288 RepID=UPI002658C2F5|nr:DUF4382 domain-containing protein [Ferruginibacter sp.]MDB5277721.1 hypothetical protein [Ferruginibacter sp.]